MGFLDLFRPKWRHSDASVRAEAVRALVADDAAILKQVVQKDADPRVRRIALKKISDTDLLTELAERDPDEGLRRDAAEKASELLLDTALEGEDQTLSLHAVDRLTAPRALSEVACKSPLAPVRKAALERLDDARALSEVARRSDDARLRLAALAKIDDAAVLRELAAGDVVKGVALAALARVSEPAALDQIVRRAKNKAVRAAAKEKLDAVRPQAAVVSAGAGAGKKAAAPVAPSASSGDPARAEREELCRRLEVADEYDDAEGQIAMARARWQALGTLPSRDAQQKRFERAVSKFLERRDAHMRKLQKAQGSVRKTPLVAMPSPEVKPEAKPEPEPSPEEKARRERAALAKQAQDEAAAAQRLIEQAERDAERKHRDEVKLKRDAERQQRQAEQQARLQADEEKRAAEQKLRGEQQAKNLQRAEEQCKNLEALLAAETLKTKTAEQALKQAAEVMSATNPLPREQGPAVRKRYDEVRSKLVIRIHELRESEDWNRFANVPKLEALVNKAEQALAAYEQSEAALKQAEASPPEGGESAEAAEKPEKIDPRDVAAYLKELQADWKAVGPAPKEKSEALWQRFKLATDALYHKLRAGTDEERTQNLKKKEQLVERMEALRAGLGDSPDWKLVGDDLKALQADWKASGPTPTKEQADALWTRFKAAADFVFEQRKARFAELDGERAENQKLKEALCAKAESVIYSTDWKGTSDLIKQYQADWKAIGPAPKEHNEALWQRFRGACDKFFDRRKAAFEKQDEERAENQKKKEALCEKAEALVIKAEEDEQAAQSEIKQLQAEWKRTGPAPKDQNELLWQRFRAACDLVFQGGRPVPVEELQPPSGEPMRWFSNKLPLAGLLDKLQGGEAAEAAAAPKTETKSGKPRQSGKKPEQSARATDGESPRAAEGASAESPTWEQDTASAWEEIDQVISSGQTPPPGSESAGQKER